MGCSRPLEKQAKSHSAALLSIGMCLLWLSLPAQAQMDPSEQRDALREYPSLAIAGSPLHEKFLELYRQAVANHSEVLKGAEGPLLLAREAAAILTEKTNHRGLLSDPDPAEVAALGFPLQATTIFVPYSANSSQTESEKMSASETVKWQTEHGYRLTLAAHFCSESEGEIPPSNLIKGASPVIEFLTHLVTACAAKDYRRVDALSLPEGNKTLEESIADPWSNRIFAKSFIESLPKRVPVKLRALLYVGKRLLVLYDLPEGEISQAILSKRGGSYFIAEHLPEEYGIDAEYFCYHLGNFLEKSKRRPTDLIVR